MGLTYGYSRQEEKVAALDVEPLQTLSYPKFHNSYVVGPQGRY